MRYPLFIVSETPQQRRSLRTVPPYIHSIVKLHLKPLGSHLECDWLLIHEYVCF